MRTFHFQFYLLDGFVSLPVNKVGGAQLLGVLHTPKLVIARGTSHQFNGKSWQKALGFRQSLGESSSTDRTWFVEPWLFLVP